MSIADLLDGKQLYVFGAGKAGRAVAEAIPYSIHCFIDNDSKKWGRMLLGIPIVSPAIVSDMDSNGFIIVGSTYYEEIKHQLLSYGYLENIHFCDGYGRLIEIRQAYRQMAFEIYDDVTNVSVNDYQFAFDHVVDKVKERYRLSSVYSFGEISHASISDLDAVLVLNEPKQKLFEIKALIQAEINSNEKLSYIYEHPPMLLNEEMSRFVSVFHTVKNIKKVWGKDCIQHSENDPFFYEKTLIWNYNFYIHFQTLMAKKKIGSREACLRLKNLAHSIQNNALVAGEPRIAEIDRIIDSTRAAAVERRLSPVMLMEAVELMSRYYKESEPEIRSQNGASLTEIDAFPERYLKLYQDIAAKRSPYIRVVDESLESLRLTYHEVRQLIGSMSIFNLDEYR